MKTMSDSAAKTVADKFAGKDIAFVASIDDSGKFWRLSVVVNGESGHYPIPHQLASGSEKEMADHVWDLNTRVLKLEPQKVAEYIARSMRR